MREKALTSMQLHLPDESEAMLQDIEKGIYNWCIDYATSKSIVKNWSNPVFAQLYGDKFRSVMANIDPNSYVGNKNLLQRLHDKQIQPHHLAFMERQQIFPEIWQSIIDEKTKRDAHIGESSIAAMTDQYKCGRCKKRECVYYEIQTRSADEPMDLRITCLNCGNRWRIG
jgi:transcription elongation factor S-II